MLVIYMLAVNPASSTASIHRQISKKRRAWLIYQPSIRRISAAARCARAKSAAATKKGLRKLKPCFP